jgi:ABC-2 type transport system permease protein
MPEGTAGTPRQRPAVATKLPRGTTARVTLASTRNAWADLTATFTVTSWTLGWLGRIIAQVVFYALIGSLLGSPDRIRYLFIGSAVLATAMEALLVVSTTTRERYSGTLPLLVAAPTRLWPVFLGRSVQWLPSGVATASVALFVVGHAFGVSFTLVDGFAAFGVLLLVAITTYGYGLALAAVVLRFMQLRNWATNLSYTVMMLVCGVMVPLTFWPAWVQWVAQIFPLTRTLEVIRLLEKGSYTAREVLVHLGLSLLVALVWYVIGALLLERLVATGRRDGTIEFAGP